MCAVAAIGMCYAIVLRSGMSTWELLQYVDWMHFLISLPHCRCVFVCVCFCVCVFVCACVHACACVCVCSWFMHVCIYSFPLSPLHVFSLFLCLPHAHSTWMPSSVSMGLMYRLNPPGRGVLISASSFNQLSPSSFSGVPQMWAWAGPSVHIVPPSPPLFFLPYKFLFMLFYSQTTVGIFERSCVTLT